jgi:hypothetical protein
MNRTPAIFFLRAAQAALLLAAAAPAFAFHVGLGNAVAAQGASVVNTPEAGYSSGPPIQFSVDAIQNPAQIAKVSRLHSCLGHPYPEQNSTNSGKHYFYPASGSEDTGPTIVSGLTAPVPQAGNTQIFVAAPCNGMLVITSYDAQGNSQDARDTQGFTDANGNPTSRGDTYHFSCSGSQTSLRLFHLLLAPTIMVNQPILAGTVLGNADIRCTPYFPGSCSDFDIAVSEQDDSNVVDYFSKLTAGLLSSHWPDVAADRALYANPATTNCSALYPGQAYNSPSDLNDYPSLP